MIDSITSELHALQNQAWVFDAIMPLIGVILGGIISLFTALFLYHIEKDKEKKRIGLSVLAVFMYAINDIHSTRNTIKRQLNNTKVLFSEDEFWQALLPILSSPKNSLLLDPTQFEFCMKYIGEDTTHKINELIGLRNIFMAVTIQYGSLRQELAALLDVHSKIEETGIGGRMTTEFPTEKNAGLLRRMGEVKELAKQYVDIADQGRHLSMRLIPEVNTKLDNAFGHKKKKFPYRASLPTYQ